MSAEIDSHGRAALVGRAERRAGVATVRDMTTGLTAEDLERADFLETLATHRGFLLYTTRDLSDEQARTRTTVSALCLGGLIKHMSRVERNWAAFIVRGPQALSSGGEGALADHEASFRMGEDETLEELFQRYEEVAHATGQLVESLPSLDDSQPLPPAPWFAPGARSSRAGSFCT